jgi:hypothetical protein
MVIPSAPNFISVATQEIRYIPPAALRKVDFVDIYT